MKEIIKFNQNSKGAEIALIYLTGHGVQVSPNNYLLPIDITAKIVDNLPQESISIDNLFQDAYKSGALLTLIGIDISRTNPFFSSTRGIGRASENNKTAFIFSTQPGANSSDGIDPTSPFASAFAAALENPNLSVLGMLNEITENVTRLTRNQQTPHFISNLPKDIYIARPQTSNQR